MKKEYLLFDLDGTLTDPKIGITKSVQYSLKSFDINVDNLDQLEKFIGPPLKESFITFYGFSEEKATLAVEKYREYFSEKGIFENNVFDGVKELLERQINNGKKLILATSKPLVFAESILKHFDLYNYFSFVAGSELDGKRSVKAEVILFALEGINIDNRDKAIMIGDREYDIIGAKKTGLQSIGVLFGFGDRAEHEKAGADYIVETVCELSALLDKI